MVILTIFIPMVLSVIITTKIIDIFIRKNIQTEFLKIFERKFVFLSHETMKDILKRYKEKKTFLKNNDIKETLEQKLNQRKNNNGNK